MDDLYKWLAGVTVLLLGFIGQRVFKKLDDLEIRMVVQETTSAANLVKIDTKMEEILKHVKHDKK